MELPTEIQAHVEAQRFDALEDHWLSRLDESATDHQYFLALGQAIAAAGGRDRLRPLVEMLDEQLAESGAWQSRFELLRDFGDLLHQKAATLHRVILDTLRELYGHLSSFEPMVEKVGLLRAPDNIPKTWRKAERLAGLMAYEVGTLVRMEGKGLGKVIEVNMALECFKVEFETIPELRVGFHAAPKMLDVLPPGHVLRRRVEEPETLEKLRDEDPSELLRITLESYDQPRTASDLKRDLTGIVSESRWNSWWSAARKHPQVLVATKGRQSYTWAATAENAYDSVWRDFEAADARGKIDLLRRDGSRDDGLRRRMSESLEREAGKRVAKDPGLAAEIFFALDRWSEAPDEMPAWHPAKLLGELEDPKPLLGGIEDRTARERAYSLTRGSREDWPQIFAEMLWVEGDARLLDQLAEALLEAGEESFQSFFDQLLSQPRRNPAGFVWLAERAADRPAWLERNPPRLIKQLTSVIGLPEFSDFRQRLLVLFDTGGTVPRLISVLAEEQAPQVLETIHRAGEIEDYRRDPLRNALVLRFPSLRQEEEAPLYATSEAIEAKREELRQIAEEELPANRKAIEEARALGDLRENFEYKSARQRHEYLSARAQALDRDLRRVRPIDVSDYRGEEVTIGTRVTLKEADSGEERVLTLLGPWDSNPEADVLSNESEQAQALLGKKPGAKVELGGVAYLIEGAEPYRK